MLVDELQQALDLVVAGLEGDEDTLASLQAPLRAVLAYSVACSGTELEPNIACVVNEVCRGLQDTVEHVLRAHGLGVNGQRDSDVHEQQRLLEFSDVDDDDVAGSTAAAESVQILHQCQRHVSGSLAEVAGMRDVIRELEAAVLWPLRMPHLFKGFRKPPKSFLLVGPPGTGKTMLVEKLAAQSGMVLLALTPASMLSKWAGESEKAIRSVFAAASAMQPSVLFLDEVDGLASQREGGDDAGSRRLLTELLIQMTAAAEQDTLFVFACTNRIQDCDAALLRRFDRRVLVPLPDTSARRDFLAKALSRPEMDHGLSEQQVGEVTDATAGYSCSDLAAVCRDAAMAPVRELMAETDGPGSDGSASHVSGPGECMYTAARLRKLQATDFMAALARCRPSSEDHATYALP